MQIIKTFIIAIPGGVVFYYLRIPLPWLLGPLTAIMIYSSVTNTRGDWPFCFRDLALIILGYSMGRTVTLETTRQIWNNLPTMFTVTMLTVIFCLIMGYITHRKTGISPASGMLGSMPGGLMQMVALSEEIKNSDLTIVTFMQTVRVLGVIFIVPFIATHGITPVPDGTVLPPAITSQLDLLAAMPAILMAPVGAWLASRLKLPTPFLLGPIFCAAAAVLCGYPALPVPSLIINLAQIFFGIYMGLSISLKGLKKLGKVFPYAIGGACALLAFTSFLGFVLTLFMPATLLTSFLSTAPGGIAEMGLTAIALHADIATVLAFQLFRLFFILLIVPPLLKWRLNR